MVKSLKQKIFLKRLHSNKEVREKISNTLKQRYEEGTIINPMQGKHRSIKFKKEHSKRMKQKYKYGLIPHNKGKSAESYEPLERMGKKVLGKLNPSKRIEVRKKLSLVMFTRIKNGYNPNKNMPIISQGQLELFYLLQVLYNGKCHIQYNVKFKDRKSHRYNMKNLWCDIAYPSRKIDYEYDGDGFFHSKIEDAERDGIFKKNGWSIKRYDKEMVKKLRLKLNIEKYFLKELGIQNVI